MPDSRAQAYAATHKLCSLAGCTGLTAGSRPCCPTKPPSRQLRLDTVLRFSTFSRTCSQTALPRSCEPARARYVEPLPPPLCPKPALPAAGPSQVSRAAATPRWAVPAAARGGPRHGCGKPWRRLLGAGSLGRMPELNQAAPSLGTGADCAASSELWRRCALACAHKTTAGLATSIPGAA